MCQDCGCEQANARTVATGLVPRSIAPRSEGEAPASASYTLRTVEVGHKILSKNDRIAALNRSQWQAQGLLAVNLISSPGAGKTRLLERTLDLLRDRVACAVVTGDLQTDHDARRLAGRGAPVRQIETGSACHLDAAQVQAALGDVDMAGIRLLFIENVGNLVCPAAFDLGEHSRVTLLSVTEGEDKPAKYPTAFALADLTLLTKIDLAEAVEWQRERAVQSLQSVRSQGEVLELSAKTDAGMQAWLDWLLARLPPLLPEMAARNVARGQPTERLHSRSPTR